MYDEVECCCIFFLKTFFGFENFGGKENDEKRKMEQTTTPAIAKKHISLFEYKVPNGGRDFSGATIRAFTKKK